VGTKHCQGAPPPQGGSEERAVSELVTEEAVFAAETVYQEETFSY
jgi:hypothetical protein